VIGNSAKVRRIATGEEPEDFRREDKKRRAAAEDSNSDTTEAGLHFAAKAA
jgi:hypothetical protein